MNQPSASKQQYRCFHFLTHIFMATRGAIICETIV
jgi:hypothetical protein